MCTSSPSANTGARACVGRPSGRSLSDAVLAQNAGAGAMLLVDNATYAEPLPAVAMDGADQSIYIGKRPPARPTGPAKPAYPLERHRFTARGRGAERCAPPQICSRTARI